MSAQPIDPPTDDPADTVERITTGEPDPRPIIRFSVDDDDTILIARKPKDWDLLELTRRELGGTPTERLSGADYWMEAVLDEESHAYVLGRLQDRDDSFDYDQITKVKDRLMGLWYGTPTGGPAASSPGPRRSGKRSKGKRR